MVFPNLDMKAKRLKRGNASVISFARHGCPDLSHLDSSLRQAPRPFWFRLTPAKLHRMCVASVTLQKLRRLARKVRASGGLA
eukprot:4604591-Pleurochrysis_carterae.AAC.1